MTKQSICTNNERRRTSRWQAFKKSFYRNRYTYILALPVIAYYLLFCYGPMYGVIIAFKKFDVAKGVLDSSWVGLKYFKDFFSSMFFPRVMKNTLIISLYDLVIGFPMPIIFALLLNEIKKNRFKKLVQTATYLPHFISMVVICGMITDFFSQSGIITKILSLFGGPQSNYLGISTYFRSIYVSTNIWQSMGWNSIIYLAALTGIDQQLYEAAKIDGAGRFKQVIHVTLPGIASTVTVMLIMRLGQIMSVGYEKIILLYNPATYETADVISSFVYRRGIGESMQFSYSTAVGLFQSVINLIMLVTANSVAKKVSNAGLF